ncbi:MAG: CidA/LrgA family protein [Arcobacter sp.]|nr:CidA/LrgA family protein [Arcobacter sp.]
MQGYIYIFALLITCDFLVSQLGLNIPGSILGLIILFTIFCFKGNTIYSIEEASKVLLKYLPLFLVPLGVGVKELIVNADFILFKMISISILSLLVAIFITIIIIRVLKLFLNKKEEAPVIVNLNIKKGEEK